MLFPTLFLLAAIPSTFAHGIVASVAINGKTYQGLVPNARSGPSAIRQVSDAGPVKISDAAMSCGHDSTLASTVATAMPGDVMSFDWKTFDGKGNWFHAVGPMITYLAACNGDCSKFNANKAQWFKIKQEGQKNGQWAQAELTKGQPAQVELPQNLAPGGYLVRHELIALHNALSVGGAEFYPSCSQIKVGGSGTGAPKASELVQFPGAYSAEDAGITVPDIFNPGFKYTFPGPPVSKLGGSGSPGGNNDDTEDPSSVKPTATKVTPAPTKGASSGSTRASSTRASEEIETPAPVSPPIAVAPLPSLSASSAVAPKPSSAPVSPAVPECKRRSRKRAVVVPKAHHHRRMGSSRSH